MHLATHTVGTQGSLERVEGSAGSESGDPTTSLGDTSVPPAESHSWNSGLMPPLSSSFKESVPGERQKGQQDGRREDQRAGGSARLR